jgi:glycosyltransferase involved in cell wall biosynthesis
MQFWRKNGIDGKLISLYTNLDQFTQLKDIDKKRELREKYGIPANKYVLIHIGHLSKGRNLKTLIPLQDDNNQVLIVTSTSTPKDSLAPMSTKSELEDSGVIVLDTYVDEVSELYQLSDLYVFPVTDECASIGLPLSILEARACGIPVLTTEYGSIKQFLADDHGSVFYSAPDQFKNMIDRIKSQPSENCKSDVRSLNMYFEKILLDEICK